MYLRCREEAFIHGKSAFCGRSVPRRGFCPQASGVLWTRTGICTRLSIQGVRFVEVRCRRGTFVHRRAVFCGRERKKAPACPHRGCVLWTDGPQRDFCPQAGGILWMRTVNCGRLSTERVPFVDGRCRGEAFVHRREVFCGCGRGIAAACPHRGCVLWTDGAEEGLLSTERVPNVDGR